MTFACAEESSEESSGATMMGAACKLDIAGRLGSADFGGFAQANRLAGLQSQ